MSLLKVCERYNSYFKLGCDGCLNRHLPEPVYVRYCTNINTENPPSGEAREAFTTALYDFNHHRYNSAIEIVKNLLVDYPVNPMYHQNIARFYERINSYHANFHFRKAIAIEPTNHLVHVNYANYSLKLNDNKTASHHFIKALQLNENDSVTHGMYAKYLRDIEKNYAKSEYHFKYSLDLNPNDNRALYHYAILLHRMRKLKLSRHYFEECLTKDMKKNTKTCHMVWHHYQYALLLKDLNDFKNAAIEFEYCLSLNYQNFMKISGINYEYGLLLCKNKQIEKGLRFLYMAYRNQPQNIDYETAFNQYKHLDLSNKNNKNNNDIDECKYSSESSSVSSSYSPMPNHLEITLTKTRKAPPPSPPAKIVIDTQVISESKETETENKNNVRPSCEVEFERWLRNKIAINKNMGDMYIFKFKNLEYNDIRLLEHFDQQTLNSVISNKLHIKMFEKQIEMFSHNMEKFVEWLKNIGVYNEYYGLLERKGILTFESFYHYINNPYDIELIIGEKNKKDACYIWNSTPKYARRVEETQTRNEGKSV